MSENTSAKKSFADRAATEPTELQKAFAAWLKEKTGVDVDLKSVQLATAFRMDFQRSEENQTALKAKKANAATVAAERLAKKRAKLEAELAKLNGETVAEEAPVAAAKPETPVVEADETPAETAPKAPAKRAPRARRTATK